MSLTARHDQHPLGRKGDIIKVYDKREEILSEKYALGEISGEKYDSLRKECRKAIRNVKATPLDVFRDHHQQIITTNEKGYKMDKNQEAYDKLIELGVSEQTMDTVCNINGFTMKTMEDILYAVFGLNDFEQL